MKINWKVRLKNVSWDITAICAVIAFVYQILGICGVVPAISQEAVVQAAGIVVNVLVAIGVIEDPTTAGVTDSEQAMTYEEPKKDPEIVVEEEEDEDE